MRETTWEPTEETEGRAERRGYGRGRIRFSTAGLSGPGCGNHRRRGTGDGIAAAGSAHSIDVSVKPRDGGVKGALAYQLIGGAAFPIRYGIWFTTEYHYLGLAGTRTYTGTATIPGLGSFDLRDRSSHDANHTVLFGIRCAFGG